MDVIELRRRILQMAQSGCPLNLQEITITPGEYTAAEFWNACQNAVGVGINRWIVISDYAKTNFDTGGVSTYIFANGSANEGSTSVIINNGASSYGGVQRAGGRGNTVTTKRNITSDMHFYAYVWG